MTEQITRLSCPLCDWSVTDDPDPDTLSSVATPLAIEQAMGVPPGFYAAQMRQEHRMKVEQTLQEHLGSHELHEWVRQVMLLKHRVDQLERAAVQAPLFGG